jgi:hypothetical protein
LLRTEAEDDAGHLTADARKLVQSKDRAVALVLNAVDDMLSAKPSYRTSYNCQTIKALLPLLELARQADRAVLLVADHGHVLSDRVRQIVKVDGAESPRYRELSAKALVSERELVLDDENTYRQRAADRVALLYRESDRYRDAHHLGEHGGASLAEVVAPAFLLAADDLYQRVGTDDSANDALQTVAWPVPAWWNLELPRQDTGNKKSAAQSTRLPESPRKQKVHADQLGLAGIAPPAQPPAPEQVRVDSAGAKGALSTWHRRLDAVYAKESKPRRDELKKVLPMLDLLVEHGGRMSDEVLAGKLAVAQRNVGALVAMLGEFLNLDGFDVVRYSASSKQVELDERMLTELFGDAV